MPTIASGTSQNITLPAGQTITFDPFGSGNAVLASGQEAGTAYKIGSSSVTIGPYSQDRTISVAATSAVGYFLGSAVVDITATRAAPNYDPTLSEPGAKAVLTSVSQVANGGSIGTRILGGRVVNSAGVLGSTFHVMMRLAAEFDSVRLILMNPTAADVINVKASVCAGGSTADPLQSGAAWTAATFAGGSTVTLPLSASTANPTITLSDWINVRGDSSKLISARVYIPSAGNTTCPIYSVGNGLGTNWAAMPNREWISRYQTGDFVATPASMNTASNTDNNAIIGIQYRARGVVYTVMGIGDSIMLGGDNPTTKADTYWTKACRTLLAEGKPVEIANCGWSGQTTAEVVARATTILASLKPQFVLYGAFSPNDGAPTDASDLAQRGRLGQMRELVTAAGAKLIGVTGLPRAASANTSAYTTQQDDYRKNFNAAVKALPLSVDTASTVSNSEALGTASWFQPGMSPDFIHLTDAGNEAAAVPTLALLRTLVG